MPIINWKDGRTTSLNIRWENKSKLWKRGFEKKVCEIDLKEFKFIVSVNAAGSCSTLWNFPQKKTRTSKNSMLILRRSIAYLKISGITFHIFIRLSTISLYGRELKKVFWIGVPTANRVSQTIYFRVLVRKKKLVRFFSVVNGNAGTL